MSGSTYTTRRHKKAFIEAFARLGIVTTSAKEAGVARQTVYDWRAADAEFVAAMDAAGEESTDLMEHEARRRGVDGTERPVFQQGVRVGTIREYSDTLLIFMLKARRPGRFRDKQVDDSGEAPPVKAYPGNEWQRLP